MPEKASNSGGRKRAAAGKAAAGKAAAGKNAPARKSAPSRKKASTKKGGGEAAGARGQGKSVTVVGGGISGLTAALRLAERGYRVRLYEDKVFLGGNVGAHPDPATGVYHDVYPHMFSTFYENFWSLLEDVGIRREDAFEPRDAVKVLREDGSYAPMTDGASARKALENLLGGVQPPADMLLWVYSMLDLMSHPIHRRHVLDRYSVNGFMRSRPYATEGAASLHDYVLMVIWSAHSYGVSAASYKDFFRYSLRQPSPLTWVLRGDLYSHLIGPIQRKLEELGVEIHLNRRVTQIRVKGGKVAEIQVQGTVFDEESHRTTLDPASKPRWEPVEHLVLAVNPVSMAWLAQVGVEGQRLVDILPGLSEARQASAEPIAVFQLYFKRKIPGIPKEHVSLWNSPMNLSFLDVSQVWDELKAPEGEEANTVLIVAASNYYGLSTAAWTHLGATRDRDSLVDELQRYLPGIEDEDIDDEKSHFHANVGDQLFIDDVGSDAWRPVPHYGEVPNLYLAGDYVLNDVGMATVEAAVTSGLLAARALHERDPQGDEVGVRRHQAYPEDVIGGMKLGLMPFAYQAKAWSAGMDILKAAGEGRWKDAVHDSVALSALPAHYVLDAWETGTSAALAFWDRVLSPSTSGDD